MDTRILGVRHLALELKRSHTHKFPSKTLAEIVSGLPELNLVATVPCLLSSTHYHESMHRWQSVPFLFSRHEVKQRRDSYMICIYSLYTFWTPLHYYEVSKLLQMKSVPLTPISVATTNTFADIIRLGSLSWRYLWYWLCHSKRPP
jgi:hypothetical protein